MMKQGTDRAKHTPEQKSTIREFNKLWHESIDGTWHKTRFLGVKAIKCPFDLWIYQELMCQIQPKLIIETGTCFGGSALFMGAMLQLIGKGGKVVTVDIKPVTQRRHAHIGYVTGDSVAPKTVAQVDKYVQAAKGGPIMVILDSNHKKAHVLKELEAYAKYVTKGSYLIVEDTNLNADVRKDHGPGPGEAVDAWLPKHPEFVVDPGCEKFYATFNPGGYLKRV